MGTARTVGSVRHRTMHGQVVESLAREILLGVFPVGVSLPPETVLCERFGVSRGAIREAVKALSAKGMLEARPRTGTKVRPRSDWNVLDSDMLVWQRDIDAIALVGHLNELRRVLEPGVAHLAALRVTPADVGHLVRALGDMEKAAEPGGDLAEFTAADVAFHTALLRACRNPLFDALAQPLEVALHIGFTTTSAVPGAVESTIPLHRAVLDAVVAGDAAGASEAMWRVLDNAEDDLNEAAALAGSSSLDVQQVVWEGLPALRLVNERLAVTVVPARGARVVEILDRRSGIQWLSLPVRDPRPLVAGAVWEEQDCAGWDELFPNIAPAVDASGVGNLAEQGDLWFRAWEVAADESGIEATISTSGFRFTRRIALEGASLRASYEVENVGTQAVEVCWAAHPLLTLTDDTVIELPAGADVVVDMGPGQDHSASPQWRSWPLADGGAGGFDRPGTVAGLAMKLFTRPGSTSHVRVSRAGSYLDTRIDPSVVPSLGLWLNNAAWPVDEPQRHLAVEPSFATADSLDLSVQRGSALRLEAGGVRNWFVEWTVGP